MFPFFLNFRLERLKNHVAKIKLTKTIDSSVKKQMNDAIEMVNFECSVFLASTKTQGGKFSSMFPWTNAYKSRERLAFNIENAYRLLKEFEKAGKFSEKLKTPSASVPITRSTSTPNITTVYDGPVPIGRSLSAGNTPLNSPEKKVNPIITTRPRIH
jgi:hypothetical protein